MTKEEEKQMTDLIKREKHSVDELKKWSAKLKTVETSKEYDVLDRFEAFKGRTDCDNMISAKNQQLLAYMNIQKNLKEQREKKAEPAK